MLVVSHERFIISGGPGSGKTTLIRELLARGETCCPEVSRELIREQMLTGGTLLPWNNLEHFAQECARRMRQQLAAAPADCRVFFDRGLPDVIGYLRRAGLETSELADARALYGPIVFFAPPWPAIYVNDPERPQSYAESCELSVHIRAAYLELGFQIVDLPRTAVGARADFIQNTLRHSRHGIHQPAGPCPAPGR